VGYSRRIVQDPTGPQIDTSRFARQFDPFGEGGTLPGYPVYDSIRTAFDCSQRCLQFDQCAGFTFKRRDRNVVNDNFICWLKFPGTKWRTDGLCGPDGRSLCDGWSRR
jgi:hypothetical protein